MGEKVLLWLDDIRPAPKGWVWCRSANAAISLLTCTRVAYASLDHDLGDFFSDGGDGTAVVDWLAENDCWPTEGISLHSANPVGRSTMAVTVNRYAPYRAALAEVPTAFQTLSD